MNIIIKSALGLAALATPVLPALAGDITNAPPAAQAFETSTEGVGFAPLEGDRFAGAYMAMVRLPGGLVSPAHVKSANMFGVVISGTLTHRAAAEDASMEVRLPAGSFYRIPAGKCGGTEVSGIADGLTGIPVRRGRCGDAGASQAGRNAVRSACEIAFGRHTGPLEGVGSAYRCFGIASAHPPTQKSNMTILNATYFSSTTLAHVSSCVSAEDCVTFLYQDGKFDFLPVREITKVGTGFVTESSDKEEN